MSKPKLTMINGLPALSFDGTQWIDNDGLVPSDWQYLTRQAWEETLKERDALKAKLAEIRKIQDAYALRLINKFEMINSIYDVLNEQVK